MTDPAAIVSEVDSLVAASSDLDWGKIANAARVMIAKAMLNDGTVSYTINGRSVTKSITELREILKMAEARKASGGGGVIAQLGEFGT